MAHYYTAARPYAKAVFAQAVKDASLEQWSVVLQGLTCITTNSKIKSLHENPKITNDSVKSVVYDTLEESAKDAVSKISDKLKNFLSLLLEEKRLLISRDIDVLYHRLLANHQKLIEVEVVSAVSLNKEQQETFYKSLEKRFKSEVSIKFLEDESLVGGALVRSGNWVLDGSIRGKIARLDEVLMS